MDNIKKFEDFLGKMQGLLDNAKKQGHIIIRVEDLEKTFPELKESEDEKIKKALMKFIEKFPYERLENDGVSIKEALAWLEKQGKQKTVWHNEDEEPQRGSLILLIMQSGTPIVAKIIEPNHTFNHGERWAYIDDLLEKQGEQPKEATYTHEVETGNGNIKALVTEKVQLPKFKVGDSIKTTNLTITKIDEKGYWSKDLYICSFDEECIWDLAEHKPAEWSEEDDGMLDTMEGWLDTLCEYLKDSSSEYIPDVESCMNWLKSLRQGIGGEQ